VNIAPKHRWLICWIYAVGILGLSIMPASALAETPEFFSQQDKVLHALMYGGWAVLLGWTLQRQMQNRPTAWMVGIVLTAAVYGALMEALQGSLTWIQRTCSWGDMLANLAGAILGVGLFVLCARPRPSKSFMT
jgi:VanZ family protein